MATLDPIELGRPRDEDEALVFMQVAADALHFTVGDLSEWAEREGTEVMRVARRGGTIVGGWAVQRMGIFFGGRSIPVGAVRAVGVAAAHRSTGVATTMMNACIKEAHEDGVPLAALYPATQPVYRKAGYGQAGAHIIYKVPIHGLEPIDRSLAVRAIDEKDHASIRSLYRSHAIRNNGLLDRTDWAWRRVFDPPTWTPKRSGFVVERDGVIEAYAVLSHKEGSSFFDHTIELHDWLAVTPEAYRRVFAYCADHRSTDAYVQFRAGSVHPMFGMLREQHYRVVERMDWMLRIVDVPAALEARGYAGGLTAELHLEVRDELIDANNARFVLSVGDGAGQVRSGGDGLLTIDIREFASMYSGHYSPYELKVMRKLDGDDDVLNVAGSIFAGPAPWMPDMF